MDEKQKKKGPGKKAWLMAGLIGLVTVAVVAAALMSGEPEIPRMKVQTPYIDLVLPLELEGLVTSDESTYGTTYTRAFYLRYGDAEVPLWRVDFGDPNAGDWVGILKTDQGEVPVVTTIFAADDADLQALGTEGFRIYGECMQSYSVMVDGIMADPRFVAERPLAIGEDTEVKLAYWTVTLPGKMQVQETTEGGNYEAVFSGEVVGETVLLYRVCIGESQTGSQLGYFAIDGVKKPVFVESYTLAERESWDEDDYETAYRMMDTINDVIEQITSSKSYSEFSAE